MQGPVLLCGLGRVGWRVLDYLRTAGVAVVAVDTTAVATDPRLRGVRLVRGDCREEDILRDAGVGEVRGVIIATSDDLLNVSCALMVRRLAPDVRIVLRMFNQNLVHRLGKTVTNVTALSVPALAAPLLALTATMGDVLAAFPVAASRRQVAEITVAADSKLVGRPVAEFDEQDRYLLVAHMPASGAPRILLEIDPSSPIGSGDRLVVAGHPNEVRKLIEPGWDDLSGVLWAGRIRRFGRIVYRTLSEMDLAVKICTSALLIVVVASTLVYKVALGHSWPDAVYRTISIISTGSELGGEQYEGWGKIFVSFLKMFGTVLVAAFTAIFTNYLLRARLGGVLELRRIPDSGHVVVIGLGNVGYGVVEELTQLKERAVVVECDANNHFIPSCRRKGVPVIVGDATVRETLQQARVKQARAVIAATSTDLGNLEVSLLVAELNEKQRVVVLLSDSVLAETARSAARVKMAVSLPELAAPAFVAGLLGDRVLSMFLIHGQMLAVVELAVHANGDSLSGRSLRSVAIDYRLVPVAVIGPDNAERAFSVGYHLAEGDRLVAIASIPDLERVTRRAPIPSSWFVEVTTFPISAREQLALQARTLRRLSPGDADSLVGQSPFRLAENQTRGQAEELLTMLQREKVAARIAEE
ncbi:MAG TPA: NAD-binding protein [Gemmataceae bacterium]|nr:NAD-binding protein [Gemmataceae bacterium]